MVLKEGQTFARCKKSTCGRLIEAFSHGQNTYWIWPIEEVN